MAILDIWYGSKINPQNQSSEANRNLADKAGLFKPVPKTSNAPTQSYATPEQLASIDAKIAEKKRKMNEVGQSFLNNSLPLSSRRAGVMGKKTVDVKAQETQTTPQLTKEQQLQIEADKKNLTNITRQVFIEEGVGMKPKISSSKKYSDIASAEKDAGIATSTPADAGADEVSKEIQARLSELANSTGSAESATKGTNLLGLEKPTDADYKALYDAQQAGDDAKYNALLETIKAKYEQAQQYERNLDTSQTAQNAQFLARAGAFSSAGGQSLVANQQQKSLERITQLQTEEASALAEAANAKRDGDLARLESYLQKADQLREERNNIQLQNVEYGQQLDEAAKTKATEQATYLGNLTLDQFNKQDPAYIAQVEQQLGMPTGYLKNLATTQDELKTTENDEKAMELSMKLFDLAKELPDGMKYEFSDGTKITGFLQPEGKVMQVTTTTGDVAFVTIDPATGDVLKNVQLPGLISEIKAARMFGGGSGGGGRSGSLGKDGIPDEYDETDLAIIKIASQGVGKTIEEVYADMSQFYGEEIPIPSGYEAGQIMTQLDALDFASDLSENIAASPGSALEILSPEVALRDIDMGDGTKPTAIYNKNTGAAMGWFESPSTPTEEKKSWGSRLLDWWNKPNETVK